MTPFKNASIRTATDWSASVRRTAVLTFLAEVTADRKRVSSTASAAPASRARERAVPTWVKIWSSPKTWDFIPHASWKRCSAASRPSRRTKQSRCAPGSAPLSAQSSS